MSYRKTHVKSRIHKIKPKKPLFARLWFWIVILVLIIISSAIYFLIFYSGVQLKNIVVLGNEKVKTEDLQALVSVDSNTELINFWNIRIISRSVFLVNTEKIKKDALEKFPEVADLIADKNLPQTIILNVTERKPIGVFCPSTGTEKSDSGCFSIDINGVVFEPVSAPSSGNTIVRQSAEGGALFAGKAVVAQNTTDIIYKIQKFLEDDFQISLNEALISSPIRLNVNTSKGWQIYFDLSSDSDINSQLIKLNLLLNGGISADDMKNLHYIDLRPKDRAIVCDNATCGEWKSQK